MASLVVVPDISLSPTLCLCLSVVASLVIRRCWPLVGHLFQPAPSPDASQSFFVMDTTKRIKCIFKCVLLVHAYYINGHIRCQLHARVVRVLKHLSCDLLVSILSLLYFNFWLQQKLFTFDCFNQVK